ncbi:UNVERIFIED_CONTAM: hypothetical protein FKN15_013415 [Acipenser sinensis]
MIIVQVHPRHAQRDPGARIVVAVEEVRVMLLKPFTILARWTIVLEVYRLTVQPPQSYSVGGQRSSGQLTGKPAGARTDYRGRWCAVSRGYPG